MTTLGSVGTISSSGIGSGLDVEGIVTKLMSIEQRPLTARAVPWQSAVRRFSRQGW